MGKPIILFLTGIPGTGKTSVASQLTHACAEAGKSIYFINDYPKLESWAMAHRGDESKVQWTPENVFYINPLAYPEASLYIAQEIAREIAHHEVKEDIFVIESARGAGVDGNRDRYDTHLFQPLLDEASLRDAFHFMNIELIVDNVSAVLERVRSRFERDPSSAPPVVVEKYISSTEGIQSSYDQAREFPEFGLNVRINNSGTPEDARRNMANILVFLLTDLANEEKTRPEGQSRNGHEWE